MLDLEHLQLDGYLLVNNFNQKNLIKLASSLGKIRLQNDSKLTEIEYVENHDNLSLTRGSLMPHVEGLYLKNPPSYLILFCISAAESGGETILYDGQEAAKLLGNDYYDITITYSRGEEEATWPLISDGTLMFRFDRVNAVEESSFDELKEKVMSVLDKVRKIQHRWQKGDLLIIDNRRCLHGRNSYTGDRCLKRVVVGDFFNSTKFAVD